MSSTHIVVLTAEGLVFTWGEGKKGQLGHGDWNSCARPTLIEGLLSVDVVDVGCGSEHVVVVGGRGDIYRSALLWA